MRDRAPVRIAAALFVLAACLVDARADEIACANRTRSSCLGASGLCVWCTGPSACELYDCGAPRSTCAGGAYAGAPGACGRELSLIIIVAFMLLGIFACVVLMLMCSAVTELCCKFCAHHHRRRQQHRRHYGHVAEPAADQGAATEEA